MTARVAEAAPSSDQMAGGQVVPDELTPEALGPWMHDLLVRLFPICRSLAGPGNRETLDILEETVAFTRTEVPSGTEAFDWTVPEEWWPKSAEITGPDGQSRARFADNNLHLVIGSEAVDAEFDLDDLLPRIHSLPDQPDLIPYVTSYYKRTWGFCMTDREKQALPPGRYRVKIEAEHRPGALTFAEAVLPGASDREILVSTYFCHPSMANDNLSGVVVSAALWRMMAARADRRFTYRFLLVPETIGAIAWLAANRDAVRDRTEAAIVFSCVGDEGGPIWKSSRQGNAAVDRIAAHRIGEGGTVMPFTPVAGSDERQFCSPGFDLPAGLLTRSHPGKFAAYHTSGDTPDFVTAEGLAGSLAVAHDICVGVEANATRWRRTDPYCEPMLSKRGLYHTTSIRKSAGFDRATDPRTALMWVLNMCDGEHSLIDIAERSGLPLLALADAVDRAADAGILESVPAG